MSGVKERVATGMAPKLARMEEQRDLRQRLWAGAGLGPDHRKVIEGRLLELIALDVEEARAEADAAYRPPAELPAPVREMKPAEARARAAELRRDALFFKPSPAFEDRQKQAALRAEVADLDRRAAEQE